MSFFRKIAQFSVILQSTTKLNFGSPESDLFIIIGLIILFWSENMYKYIKTCLKVVLIIILKKIEEIKHKKT